jgi:hypothetical protein
MPGNSTSEKSNLKHYSINILIILIAAICILLLYFFFARITSTKQETTKEVIDTVNNRVTKQPTGQTLQIDIQNGTGVQGLADKFADYLLSHGCDVVDKGNFSTSDIKNSMVIDRKGNSKNAKRFASILGISEKNVIEQKNDNYLLDATVVIGMDYSQLKPFKEQIKP